MASIQCKVTLPYQSGLPQDVAVNTWHASTDDVDNVASAAAFVTSLKVLYAQLDSGFSSLLGNTATFTVYNLDDPKPRVPIYESTASLTVGSDALPCEVAVCLSFQGLPLSGMSQASRRGRVFLGPWSVAGLDTATGRPSSAIMTGIDTAATNLLTASGAAASWSWVVHNGAGVDVLVNNGWVDNEFDTQRRRGLEPTARNVFP